MEKRETAEQVNPSRQEEVPSKYSVSLLDIIEGKYHFGQNKVIVEQSQDCVIQRRVEEPMMKLLSGE